MNNPVLNEFKNFLLSRKSSINTITSYLTDIKQLFSYLETKYNQPIDINNIFCNLNANSLTSFISFVKENLQQTSKTISRKLNSIRTFAKFLSHKYNLAIYENIKVVNAPKVIPKQLNYLNKLQVSQLRQNLYKSDNLRDQILVEFLLSCGLQISEASNLKVKDIDLKRKLVTICSVTSRKVPISNKLKAMLFTYIKLNKLQDNNYIVQSCKRQKMNIRNVRNIVYKYLYEAKLYNYSPRDLRHTFIIHQLNNNVELQFLCNILGWKTTININRYIKLAKQRKNKNGEHKEILEI